MIPSDLDQRRSFDLGELREERLCADLDRALVARQVLAIVALFAGEVEICEYATGGRVSCAAGETSTLAAERQVRELGDRAETVTLQLSGARRGGDVVCDVPGREYLLEDYQRIRRVEHHRAFGDEATAAGQDAYSERLSQLAAQARETAQTLAESARWDTRVCRCGASFGRHRRNTSRQPWEHPDRGVCDRFDDVEDLPCSAVKRETVEAAVKAATARAGVGRTEVALVEAMRLLDQMCAGGKGRTLLIGDAIRTAANTLDW